MGKKGLLFIEINSGVLARKNSRRDSMADKHTKMNPVVHFEMPAEDRKRMADFYTNVFGWKTQMLGPEMGDYVLAFTTEVGKDGRPKNPGAINGGFFLKSEDGAPRAKPVPARRSAPSKHLASKSYGTQAWSLREIPAYAPGHCSASVRKRQGFGGLSASSEIRRSSQTSAHDRFCNDLRNHPRPKALVFCVGG
jgi:catechol 2,3-dioxygenase-like lactoylglutathione lyase family enzyme